MNKIIHIALFFVFAFSVSAAQAQSDAMFDYWKDMDFNDTTLISSKSLTDQLLNFFFSFTDGDEQRFDSLSVVGLGVVLEKAKVNMGMYEFILAFALQGYAAMGRDRVTDYLLRYPKLAEGEIPMEEGLRLDSITEPYQKVKIGAKAPDFYGVSLDGRHYHLYESTAKKTIVFFWSTDCEYCHDFLLQIHKNLDLKSDYELVTFAIAENKDEVTQTVKKMRLQGYHFYDELRWEGKAFVDFHITSTPTVFLVDADKTIVCKPYDWNDLKKWLKQNK